MSEEGRHKSREHLHDNRAKPHLLASGVAGGGQAQPLDTPIPVPVCPRFPDGWASIGELVVGDHVWSVDGEPAAVTSLSPIREEPTYRFYLFDGQVLESGGNHLWEVSTWQGHDSWTFAEPDYLAEFDSIDRLTELAFAMEARQFATLEQIATFAALPLDELTEWSQGLDCLAVIGLVEGVGEEDLFDVEAVVAGLEKHIETGNTLFSYELCAADLQPLVLAGQTWSGWLSRTAITDVIAGRIATDAERREVRELIDAMGLDSRVGAGTISELYFPVDEVLYRVAQRLWYLSHLAPSERGRTMSRMLLTSEQIAQVGVDAEFGIEAPKRVKTSEVELPIEPYRLGYLLGNASMRRRPRPGERWWCSNHDGPTEPHFTAAEIAGPLKGLGVIDSPVIPTEYKCASPEQRRQLLSGIMAAAGTGDGSGDVMAVVTTERLARDICEVANSLGTPYARWGPLVTAIDITSREARVAERRWLVTIPTAIAPSGQAQFYQIGDIEVAGSQPMRCIGVDHPSRMYLTNNFVPTHSSTAATTKGAR